MFLGGLRPRSDIDVLAVSSRPTTPEEKRLLVERLVAITGVTDPGPPWTVELTIVVESEVRPWRYPPRLDFQYGEWVRHAFEHGNYTPWKERDPDLALLITVALQGGRLCGVSRALACTAPHASLEGTDSPARSDSQRAGELGGEQGAPAVELDRHGRHNAPEYGVSRGRLPVRA